MEMKDLAGVRDTLDDAIQLVNAIDLMTESLDDAQPFNAVARVIEEKIKAADETVGEILDKYRAIEKEELAKEEAKQRESMKEKISENVRGIITPLFREGWRKSLADAEEAATKGDEEAAKDAEALRLWIDMYERHEAKEAAPKEATQTA
jgi:hypothetical protein